MQDTEATSAVFFWHDDAGPPTLGEGVVVVPRERVIRVAVPPVVVIKLVCQPPGFVPDAFEFRIEREVHVPENNIRPQTGEGSSAVAFGGLGAVIGLFRPLRRASTDRSLCSVRCVCDSRRRVAGA